VVREAVRGGNEMVDVEREGGGDSQMGVVLMDMRMNLIELYDCIINNAE
jgi:hypothetical protein